jgi:DNA-binding winged helix-turn-helix (wHTH) protein
MHDPCLLYSYPDDPDNTHLVVLREAVTCIGRLGPERLDPPEAGLVQLHGPPTVSLCHAKIIRSAAGFQLQNWEGRYGIGLYERELSRGEQHLLSHCDSFRLPNLEQHVRFQFLETADKTRIAPFQIERSRGRVYIFGERVELSPQEYALIAYLHQRHGQLCLYEELIAATWPEESNALERKESLEVLLAQVRKKLRDASGGFTFLQTVRGQGVCFIV